MPSLKRKGKPVQPATVISLSFFAVILVGAILLMMPFSSAAGVFTSPMTAIFTATSATCVTGLVLVDTGTYWNTFGQIVILIMIQIGGLGLVTFASFFNIIFHRKLELHSMQIASESVNTSGFYDVKVLVKSIIGISFLCELAGGLLLTPSFVLKYGMMGIYIAFYISVTSFCNAGFDIMGLVEEPFSSLAAMANDPGVVLTVPLLIIAGGLGFVVWNDVVSMRRGKKRFALQSQISIGGTIALTVFGTLSIMIMEWSNPDTLGGTGFLYKLGNSFFSSVTCRTAGFNTIDFAACTPLTKMISIFLMFIGAAPGSTGGGLKITSFTIIVMTVICVLRNKDDTVILGRRIEKDLVYKALSIMFMMIMLIICVSIAMTVEMPDENGLDVAFEVTSALSTAGLSAGVTAHCGIVSKILLCLTMFIGRVGPVGFAISLTIRSSHRSKNEVYPDGKLMVG